MDNINEDQEERQEAQRAYGHLAESLVGAD